jgi:hypothetical protein
MKLSRLLEELQALKSHHGDIVVTINAYPLTVIEVNDWHYIETDKGGEKEVQEKCVEMRNS